MIGTNTHANVRGPILARVSPDSRTAFGRWISVPTAITILETFYVVNNFDMLVIDFFNWKSHQHNDSAANILKLSPKSPPRPALIPKSVAHRSSLFPNFSVKSTQSLVDFESKLYFRTSWMLITTMHNFHISTHKGKEINSIVFNKMIFNRIA